MKHGIHLPQDKRPAMARRALQMIERGGKLSDVQARFDVSGPTARNLVRYGRYLRREKPPIYNVRNYPL